MSGASTCHCCGAPVAPAARVSPQRRRWCGEPCRNRARRPAITQWAKAKRAAQHSRLPALPLPPPRPYRWRAKLGPADFELLARATRTFGPLTNAEAAVVVNASISTIARLRREGVLPPGRIDHTRNQPVPSKMALGRFRLGVPTSVPAPPQSDERWPRCAECHVSVQSLVEHWQAQHAADPS